VNTIQRIFVSALLIAMTQSLASAQLRFDVASIRPTTDRHDESLIVNPGGLIYSRVSLKDCLESAYSVKRYQISGPDWLETQLFDITARVEGNHSKDEIMLMLQTLLADRFNLALHREQKELPVYALLVGKNGSKLHKSDGDGDFSMGPTSGGIGFQRISMADFAARFLSRLPPIGRPVLDKTGLEGRYDFTLALATAPGTGADGIKKSALEEGFSLFAYALDQLGLRLDAQKTLMDMLIVDHVEKTPTEN
jgi:uncharacterized protein (TIGR03435 family)